jgi:hypothetical protein
MIYNQSIAKTEEDDSKIEEQKESEKMLESGVDASTY